MTDLLAGFIVVLDRNMREDEAEATLAALRQIKGVIKVAPMVSEPEHVVALARVTASIKHRLHRAVDSVFS